MFACGCIVAVVVVVVVVVVAVAIVAVAVAIDIAPVVAAPLLLKLTNLQSAGNHSCCY